MELDIEKILNAGDTSPDFKSGFIAIVGRPNVGKSTLLNQILGEKITITADKPQTTRNRIIGIYTGDDCQMILIDTPGIHKPKSRLGKFMTDAAISTFKEVDHILFMVDDKISGGTGDRYILNLLKEVSTAKTLIINKIDTMKPDLFKRIYDEYDREDVFDEIFGISALNGKNVKLLIEGLKDKLSSGPKYFPAGISTDQPMRTIASEIIREKLLLYLKDEVPHGTAVVIEEYNEAPDITKIEAVIYCERKSHKGIIIGRDGHTLKGIGKDARLEIEALEGKKVFLKLWVKIKENWRDNPSFLNNIGY